ncbi:MAG: magnesium protoporphyrin IX methyltransferase [Pseudomonadota bacterium]
MASETYETSRSRIEDYFDRTAAETWERLTSDAPVSRVRATVREGRDRMRETLLSWLPADLRGARILDAGCGTGAFAVEAARRGAEVVAIDLSPTLVRTAEARLPGGLPGRVTFHSGDMLDPALGHFDHAVAMDSLIHYRTADMVRALTTLADRVDGQLLFTIAPRTPLLSLMHAAGKLFPRGDRSPMIVPVGRGRLRRALQDALPERVILRQCRVKSGFYISDAQELSSRC